MLLAGTATKQEQLMRDKQLLDMSTVKQQMLQLTQQTQDIVRRKDEEI